VARPIFSWTPPAVEADFVMVSAIWMPPGSGVVWAFAVPPEQNMLRMPALSEELAEVGPSATSQFFVGAAVIEVEGTSGYHDYLRAYGIGDLDRIPRTHRRRTSQFNFYVSL
jgi:hypothetical protein